MDPLNGEASEIPMNPDTTVIRLDGTVLEVREEGDGPQGQAYRIARMTSLMLPKVPVSIGGRWSAVAHSDKVGIPDLRVEYTLVAEEKVGRWNTYRITAKGGESGAEGKRVEATFWVDKATGNRVRTKAKVVSTGDGKSGAETIETDIVRQS